MLFRRIFLVICLLQLSKNVIAQGDFYNIDSISEIRLYFFDANWDHLLDSMYVVGEKDRVVANIIINGDSYDSVGVRYKGFSSVSINTIKNPFNISLDYLINDQDHKGINKIKLSNVIQDPSFVREVLSYDIARKYMPASKANFSNLFINDTLWGLYVNVEAVNEKFLVDHFGSKNNSFFKCNPENLNIQIGGENSNLSNSHGNDSTDYYNYYDLESDYGWTQLYNLIDTLNNYSDSVYKLLNIDRALWMHAFNYTLINYDSYIGYGQNYYLYKQPSLEFSPILWDMNMSFGGFRLTDASQLYFNGFNISQAQTMDPFIHYYTPFISPRPLIEKLFQSTKNQKMFMAHIRTIVEENFLNQDYYSTAQYLQNMIDASVQNDTNKFYSYNDFNNNLNNQVSLTASICPGISELVDARANYLSNYSGFNGAPIVSNVNPQSLVFGNDFYINADVLGSTDVVLYFRFGENMRFKEVNMFDDGNHNDGLPNDGTFGALITNTANSVDYYIYAENDSSGIFSPERAAHEFYSISTNIPQSKLVINEVMSNNKSTVTDNSGKYDDWIELFNNSSTPISTNKLFFSDNLQNISKWKFPNIIIKPQEYFIIWADEDGHQGNNHANFKLSNLGEQLIISNNDSSIIDAEYIYTQQDDISYGRSPNGVGSFTMLTPTFNQNNTPSNTNNTFFEDDLVIFPNPFNDYFQIIGKSDFKVYNMLGEIIYYGKSFQKHINTSKWIPGIYFLKSTNDNLSLKLIKIK